jgi:Protein of unknown function (DUF2924)
MIMRRRWREPAAIAAEIDRIRSLRLDALRRQWQLVFGRVPPIGLSKDLLGRMMAARLQERAFGGLDRDSLRFLESLARYDRPPPRQLKPGWRRLGSKSNETGLSNVRFSSKADPPRMWPRQRRKRFQSIEDIRRQVVVAKVGDKAKEWSDLKIEGAFDSLPAPTGKSADSSSPT